jgi:hypothetical protein
MLKPKYFISKDSEFVIENYNSAPTFASFLPGIAGAWGIPMWVFYANRGQCITSFGIHDKDGSLMEFQAANKAYRSVALNGFRTFIKVSGTVYEPFLEVSGNVQDMKISHGSLEISEKNKHMGLDITVKYFTLPGETFPALVRVLKIKNTSSKKTMDIMDGMPAIIPVGFANVLLKNISQTIEAWSIVENLENGIPFYKLKVSPADVSETIFIKEGNFMISNAYMKGKVSDTEAIVDPKLVFGEVSGLEFPGNFAEKNFKVPADQVKEGFIPAAFAYKKAVLKKNAEIEIISVFGRIDSVEELNRISDHIKNRSYIALKEKENTDLINNINANAFTDSASTAFNLYTAQTYLDNVMRGGLPISFGNKVFYSYYRKHGDMERDYNDFKVVPSYLSQGNGNYRDINQNRRSDVFFNPDVRGSNVMRFFELVQLDGYNPLVVLPERYKVMDREKAKALIAKHIKSGTDHYDEVISSPFMVGSLVKAFENDGATFKISREAFLTELLAISTEIAEAAHGEGYWIDHFSYNTDLLESFGAVYPEEVKALLFNNKTLTFRESDHIVLDRADKYHLVNGKVRQYRSVKVDAEKKALVDSRKDLKWAVRTANGKGEIYRTTIAAKILTLIATKISSLDPNGIGIEMEAEKPDWYDALNGLPGLIGSSLSETLELKRLCQYLLDHVDGKTKVALPVEVSSFITELNGALNEADTFTYWNNSTSAREAYRHATKLGISGKEAVLDGTFIKAFIDKCVVKCNAGIKKSLRSYKNYYTYFINEASDFDNVGGRIVVKKFSQKPLPLFLEGFVHALKVEKDLGIYGTVRKSGLFDKKLKMYKVNSSLKDETIEIGRAKVFAAGWLENESVFLHMEYKYLLEILKAGMYKEFFSDMKDALIPFTDPAVYKRSIFENSSFIASSAHPDPNIHGRGYVARLSGGAAEFLDMWIIMTTGKNMFQLDQKGNLTFRLAPILPAWLFKKTHFSFKLLGSIDVTYINEKKKDTFAGLKVASYKLKFENKEIELKTPILEEKYALLIRERKVKKIIVTLA